MWARYLNPFVPALETTVIDVLISTMKSIAEQSSLDQTETAALALAGLVVNGLANIGPTLYRFLQGDLKRVTKPNGSSGADGKYWFSGKEDISTVGPEKSEDWVKLRMDSTIDGYAYDIRGPSPKIAISFLLTFIALGHVLYAMISGNTTSSITTTGHVS